MGLPRLLVIGLERERIIIMQEKNILAQINRNNIPKHVAVIMDGNGRWAQKKGNQRIDGHRQGVQSVEEICAGANELGINYITLYAFSKENWERPKDEVEGLMSLLVHTLHEQVDSLLKNNISLHVIGDIDSLPQNVTKELKKVQELTQSKKGPVLNLALSYSARWEIIHAVKRFTENLVKGKVSLEELSEEVFGSYLTTSGIPDPELLIRTGGEQRVSNFLLWQISYAELYFTDKLWPDFKREDLYRAVYDYQRRERRFGKTAKQVKSGIQ